MKVLCVVLAVCAATNAGVISGGYSGGHGYSSAHSGGHGGAVGGGQVLLIATSGAQDASPGSSLTVAGPSHIIRTIHQVRTIDHGGEILAKTGGSSSGIAKILIVNSGSLEGGAGGSGGYGGHAASGWW